MSSRAPSDERAAVSLAWLVRLRWGTVAGQVAAVGAAAWVIGPSFSAGRLLALVGLLAASNLALARLGAPAPGWACGAALTLDALLLTGLLHATGGPSNPFSILYLSRDSSGMASSFVLRVLSWNPVTEWKRQRTQAPMRSAVTRPEP